MDEYGQPRNYQSSRSNRIPYSANSCYRGFHSTTPREFRKESTSTNLHLKGFNREVMKQRGFTKVEELGLRDWLKQKLEEVFPMHVKEKFTVAVKPKPDSSVEEYAFLDFEKPCYASECESLVVNMFRELNLNIKVSKANPKLIDATNVYIRFLPEYLSNKEEYLAAKNGEKRDEKMRQENRKHVMNIEESYLEAIILTVLGYEENTFFHVIKSLRILSDKCESSELAALVRFKSENDAVNLISKF